MYISYSTGGVASICFSMSKGCVTCVAFSKTGTGFYVSSFFFLNGEWLLSVLIKEVWPLCLSDTLCFILIITLIFWHFCSFLQWEHKLHKLCCL